MGKSIKDIKPYVPENNTTAKKSIKDIAPSPSYGNGVDNEYINTFITRSQNFFDNASKMNYGNSALTYKVGSDSYLDLKDRSSAIKQYYRDNKNNISSKDYDDMMAYLNSFDASSRDAMNYMRNNAELYSQFATEEDYNKFDAGWLYDGDDINTPEKIQKRKDYYAKNLAQITALSDQARNAKSKDEFESIVAQIDAIKTENRQYERTQQISDDYQKYTQMSDFATVSKNNNFVNPTEQDMTDYYNRMEGGYTVGKDGLKRDIYGDVVDDSYYERFQEPVVVDKLGLYMSYTQEDLDAALSDTNRQYSSGRELAIKEGIDGDWNKLKSNEVDIYYYLLNTSGKDVADKYLSDMKTELNRRAMAATNTYLHDKIDKAQGLEKIALEFALNASTVPAQMFGGLGFIEDAYNMLTGNDINPYSHAHAPAAYSSEIRGTIAKQLDEWAGGLEVPLLDFGVGDFYQALMSSIDSRYGAKLFGKGYTTLMGMNAAQSEARELYEKGASVGQIAFGSMTSGAAEIIFETVSLEHFLDTAEKGTKTFKQFIKQTLAQGGVEASEEMATEVANIFIDAINMRGQSEWQKLLNENEGDVKAALFAEVKNVLNAGAGGFVSGGGMAMLGSGGNLANYHFNQSTNIGKQAVQNHSFEMANDFASGNEVSKRSKALQDRASSIDTNGNLTNKDYRAIGKFVDSISDDMTAQSVKAEISDRLTEANFDADPKVVDAIYKYITSDADIKIASKEVRAFAKSLEDSGNFNQSVSVRLAQSNNQLAKNYTEKSYKANLQKAYGDQVSETGETVDAKTGEKVSITTIASTKNGELLFNTSEGKAVSAKSIKYASVEDAAMYKKIADLGCSPQVGNYIVSMAKASDMDAVAYAKNAALAYTYGLTNEANKLSRLSIPETISNQLFKDGRSAKAKYEKSVRKHGKVLDKVIANSRANAETNTKKGNNAKTEGKVIYESDIDTSKLSGTKKSTVEFVEGFAEVSSMNVHLYETYQKDGKTYAVINGSEQEISANGYFATGTNDIYIDINSGSDYQGIGIFTLGHEVGHYIREWNAKGWQTMADLVVDAINQRYANGEIGMNFDAMFKDKLDLYRKLRKDGNKDYQVSNDVLADMAYEDVVCDAVSSLMADKQTFKQFADNVKAKDKGLWNKIKETILNFIKRLDKILASFNNASTETASGDALKGAVEEMRDAIRDAYVSAFVGANENFLGAETEVAEESTDDIISKMLSNEATDEEVEKFLELATEDEINEQTEEIGIEVDKETESVSPFSQFLNSERTWTKSEYVTERDKTAMLVSAQLGVSKEQAYKYIDDINSVAKAIADDRIRLDYESNMDEDATVIKPNSEYKWTVDMSTLCAKRLLFTGTFDAIQKALPNTVFNSEDIVKLRKIMEDRNYQVACGICYVESTRREIGAITNDFIEQYKKALKTGKPITKGNGGALTVEGKSLYAEKGYIPTLADLNTTDIDLVKRDHPKVYEAYLAFMNARGQAKPKLLETRAEYKGEILKHFKSKSAVDARNNKGGLRLQSFSDFEVPHLIDMMQITMDMARVGLKSQAYTKVPAFADAFGNTGIKINLSLIAKGSGLDSKGNLIFDDVEGIDHKEAFRLRDKYSKNVGTILVGKNNAHIKAAMADPRIDFIIPFHKSSWKESLYDALGLTGYSDYTNEQNEKPIDPNRKIKNFDPSEYWDFTKSGDENAQIYLQKCEEDGRHPKFEQFKDYPGYWKLLIDFKMYDNDGVGSPQEVVRPEFNDEVNQQILKDYKGGHRSFPVAKDVVDDFVKEYKKSEPEVKYSDRNSYDPEKASIIEQIKNASDTLDKMDVVDSISVPKQVDTIAKAYQYVKPILAKYGYQIDRQNFGVIDFSEKLINAGDRYLNTIEEVLALATIPKVLKRGIEIGEHIDHKNRGKSTKTFGAPVSLNGKRGNVGVVVNLNKNKYYTHRIVFPDGSSIVLKKSKKNIAPTPSRGVADNSSLAKTIGATSNSRVANDNPSVKSLNSERATAPTFYSHMSNVIDGIKTDKVGANGVIPYLKGKGVKDEEIKWSGIATFLDGKKSLTKADLQEFAKSSMLQIEEKTLGSDAGASHTEFVDNISAYYDFTPDDIESFYDYDEQFNLMAFRDFIDGLLKEDEINETDHYNLWDIARDYNVAGDNGTHWSGYKTEGTTNYRELLFKIPGSDYTNSSMQTHWGEKGVLAHARIDDLETSDGGKVLFVEEIQSDWHNEGNKVGYKESLPKLEDQLNQAYYNFYTSKIFDDISKEYFRNRNHKYSNTAELMDELINCISGSTGAIKATHTEKYESIVGKDRYFDTELYNEVRSLAAFKFEVDNYNSGKTKRVPDAPFRNGKYIEFVMKRLLRMAAEEGYDSIGWTTGKMQEDRWSNEYAEGYRIEYDQDIPKFMNKYGKQWGAKVEKTSAGMSDDYSVGWNPNTQSFTLFHYFEDNSTESLGEFKSPSGEFTDESFAEAKAYFMSQGLVEGDAIWTVKLTPEMKESVLTKGQALYSERATSSDPRTSLAKAMMGLAENEVERKYVEEYQANIEKLNEQQKKLEEIKAEIKNISFTTGKRDKVRLQTLRDEATKITNRLDIYDKKLLKLEAAKPLQRVIQSEKAKALAKAKVENQKALAESKQKLADYKQEQKEKKEVAKERREASDVRSRIRKIADDLTKKLQNPSERRFIPTALAGSVIDVCNAIDPTGRTYYKPGTSEVDVEKTRANYDATSKAAEKYKNSKQALLELKLQYDNLRDSDNYDYSSEFNEEFSSHIGQLANVIGDTPLREMSDEQLADVYDILNDISFMVETAAKQIGTEEAISNYEAGQEIIAEMNAILDEGLTTNKVSTLFREWTENPMRAVREMTGFKEGSRLMKLFDALNEGRIKADKFRMDSQKKFDALRESKEDQEAFNNAVERPSIEIEGADGNKVKISKMQAMQAILTYEREQANPNRKHLDAPVRFTDVSADVKGNYSEAFDKGFDAYIDDKFIQTVKENLDAWDQVYLDVARKFFNVDSKDAVNSVTMVTKHRLVANEKAYIPYYVNQDYIAKESENISFNASIENMGMLKSVKDNASQQLIIRGLNTVVADHINKVAKIYGLAIPVRNFNKVFNMKQTKNDGGKTVKVAIRKTWNEGGLNLIDQAVADLQSPRRSENAKILGKVKSAFVTSTLASNLSVWMKQAASYPTAGSVLSASSLSKALPKFGRNLKATYDEIDAHTPQHYMRRLGLSTQELGDMNQSKGWQNKLNQRLGNFSPMNWIQAMDVKTTAVLWEACKYEAENKGLSGEEYWEEVTRLYNKVLEETQPMYDSLHRAEITKNNGFKNIIMFQTQPIQNSGILREGAMEYKVAKKLYGSKSSEARTAQTKFIKAVTSQMASHFVFTTMTLFSAALLHKMNPWRDDDKEVTAESVAKEFLAEFGKNYFGAIMPVVGNYAISVTQKFVGTNRYDVLSDPTVDKLNSTIDAFAKIKEPSWDNYINLACEVASYFGIPANNVINIINGARLHIEDAVNGEFLSFEAGVERTSTQNINISYKAYLDGDTEKFKSIPVKNSDITRVLKPQFLEAYKSNDTQTMANIRKYMKATGAYKDDVIKVTQDWIKNSNK